MTKTEKRKLEKLLTEIYIFLGLLDTARALDLRNLIDKFMEEI